MIERYSDPRIEELNSLKSRYLGWQRVELAVIKARVELGRIPQGLYEEISEILKKTPINLEKVAENEKTTDHDLNAFIEERRQYLQGNLSLYLHLGMTSYDTEEAAFATTLKACCDFVCSDTEALLGSIKTR